MAATKLNSTDIDGKGQRFVTEASCIGLRPHLWPDVISNDIDSTGDFQLRWYDFTESGAVASALYTSDGYTKLTVIND